MPFLPPNQQHQSTEGKSVHTDVNTHINRQHARSAGDNIEFLGPTRGNTLHQWSKKLVWTKARLTPPCQSVKWCSVGTGAPEFQNLLNNHTQFYSVSKEIATDNMSVFSCLRQLQTWYCSHLLLTARMLQRRCCWVQATQQSIAITCVQGTVCLQVHTVVCKHTTAGVNRWDIQTDRHWTTT